MKHRPILLIAALALMVYSCQNKPENGNDMTLSPESGTTYKSGEPVNVKIHLDPSTKFDSVVYMLDSTRLAAKKDTSALTIKTDTLPLGSKTLTAKVYNGGKDHDASSNFVLLAAKAPEEFTYKVEKKYPHDSSAYTEGFTYKDGYIYESTGDTGKAKPRIQKSDLETGKVLQAGYIDPHYFGEGSVIVGNKIVMITWKNKVGYVFDKSTFKVLNTFNDNVGVEGWGMTTDGNKIYRDDSTNRIWFMDTENYHATGYIDVYDDKGPVDSLNELEYINGKIYANRYTYDYILVIDPKTGAVLQKINMANLWPKSEHPASYTEVEEANNVLNGIAWDEKGKRLLVTGKRWPYIYQISLVKK